MAGKTKQSEPKMRLDLRAKMYIVLVICSLMLLASVGVAFFLVGGVRKQRGRRFRLCRRA